MSARSRELNAASCGNESDSPPAAGTRPSRPNSLEVAVGQWETTVAPKVPTQSHFLKDVHNMFCILHDAAVTSPSGNKSLFFLSEEGLAFRMEAIKAQWEQLRLQAS